MSDIAQWIAAFQSCHATALAHCPADIYHTLVERGYICKTGVTEKAIHVLENEGLLLEMVA